MNQAHLCAVVQLATDTRLKNCKLDDRLNLDGDETVPDLIDRNVSVVSA